MLQQGAAGRQQERKPVCARCPLLPAPSTDRQLPEHRASPGKDAKHASPASLHAQFVEVKENFELYKDFVFTH